MPCSAGTLKISPRASNSARFPVGDSAESRVKFVTLIVRGRSVARSVTTVICTSRVCPLARSSRCSRPLYSNTISSGPMLGKCTSASANFVTCRVCFVVVS